MVGPILVKTGERSEVWEEWDDGEVMPPRDDVLLEEEVAEELLLLLLPLRRREKRPMMEWVELGEELSCVGKLVVEWGER